jgi:ubiquinone/menaquinone biosynthesis C-methylase UbiE
MTRLHNATLRRAFNRWSRTYRTEIIGRVERRGYGYSDLASAVTAYLRGTNVLEVGTGPGNLGVEVKHQLDRALEITGVDISTGMLTEARRTAAYLDLIEADATQLPFADSSFDSVYSTFMLHSASNAARAVSEFYRVCRWDGTVIIVDLMRFRRRIPILSLISDNAHSIKREHAALSRYFSAGELVDMMLAVGFGAVSARSLGPVERFRHAIVVARKSDMSHPTAGT